MERLPKIGFGTGQLKGQVGCAAVTAAIEGGYRLIDTGAIYNNEQEVGQEVGQAVAEASVDRKDILLVTKGAHDPREHGYGEVMQAFRASLGRLAVGYIDYYLVHWPSNPERRQETWEAMQDIWHSGDARAIGVSNYAVHHLKELKVAAVQPAVNQIEFHPYIFAEQQEILAYCHEQGIAIMGYSTFANGQADTDQRVVSIASRLRATPRQVLAQWSIQHGVLPLVRSRTAEHIAENFEALDLQLSADDMEILNNLHGRREFPDPNLMV